jgi:hypothetical protein
MNKTIFIENAIILYDCKTRLQYSEYIFDAGRITKDAYETLQNQSQSRRAAGTSSQDENLAAAFVPKT